MKCPVCYTKIKLGENRCPNCGMFIKEERSITQTNDNKTIVNQAHNKTNHYQKEINDFLNQSKIKMNSKSHKQIKSLIGGWNFIFFVLFILFFIRMFIGIGFDYVDFSETYYALNDAYEAVADDGTIETVMDLKNNIEAGLFNYDCGSYDERVEVYDNSIEVYASYNAMYGNCDVTVYIEASNAEVNCYNVTFDGYYYGLPSRNEKPFKDVTISYMMDELGCSDAYEDYEEIRKEAIKNTTSDYNEFHERKYEDYIISFNEYYDKTYDQTSYTITYIMK